MLPERAPDGSSAMTHNEGYPRKEDSSEADPTAVLEEA